MIRAISFLLCVVAGVALTSLLAPYMPTWALFLVALVALVIWGYTVDKGFKDNG